MNAALASLSLAALLGLTATASAQGPGYPGPRPGYYGPGPRPLAAVPYAVPRRANPAVEAAAALREGLDKLLDFLAKNENKLQVAAFLDREIAPYFAFERMARWVAGPRFDDLDEAARKALTARIEAHFLGTLAQHLAAYDGQQVRFFRPRYLGHGRVGVPLGIARPGGHPVRLDFRLQRFADGWKIQDLIVNGRSALAYYRGSSEQRPRQLPYPGIRQR